MKESFWKWLQQLKKKEAKSLHGAIQYLTKTLSLIVQKNWKIRNIPGKEMKMDLE